MAFRGRNWGYDQLRHVPKISKLPRSLKRRPRTGWLLSSLMTHRVGDETWRARHSRGLKEMQCKVLVSIRVRATFQICSHFFATRTKLRSFYCHWKTFEDKSVEQNVVRQLNRNVFSWQTNKCIRTNTFHELDTRCGLLRLLPSSVEIMMKVSFWSAN